MTSRSRPLGRDLILEGHAHRSNIEPYRALGIHGLMNRRRPMNRLHASLFVSLIGMSHPTYANEINVVTESGGSSSSVTIIQTSPGETKAETHVQSAPGSVVVKQRGQNSSAVIIQRTGPQERNK
ncbi:hypothetical protein [Methylocystis echinoides]|uniref:hypothetical protein n=1 Tax=Methylocystis echinoides TaxID=29468 RepID=UPI00343B9947